MKESDSKTVSQIGERGLIERLTAICGTPKSEQVIIGIGDDTAALKLPDGRILLATCDIQLEDIHFTRSAFSPHQIGRRAIAVNISDIAAMGGVPTLALVSMALPEDYPVGDFDEIFCGMRDMMTEYGGSIIGGNLTRADGKLAIDVFLLGEAEPGRLTKRSGARPGDAIYTTCTLGMSAAGLDILEKFGLSYPKEFEGPVKAHLEPQPRVREAQKLVKSGAVTAMIDVSDGLATDLWHICEQSRTGAEIYQAAIAIPAEIEEAAILSSKSALDYILNGGEDYELLFAVEAEACDRIEKLASAHDFAVKRIGKVLPERSGVWLVAKDQRRTAIQPLGWDHFVRGTLTAK